MRDRYPRFCLVCFQGKFSIKPRCETVRKEILVWLQRRNLLELRPGKTSDFYIPKTQVLARSCVVAKSLFLNRRSRTQICWCESLTLLPGRASVGGRGVPSVCQGVRGKGAVPGGLLCQDMQTTRWKTEQLIPDLLDFFVMLVPVSDSWRFPLYFPAGCLKEGDLDTIGQFYPEDNNCLQISLTVTLHTFLIPSASRRWRPPGPRPCCWHFFTTFWKTVHHPKPHFWRFSYNSRCFFFPLKCIWQYFHWYHFYPVLNSTPTAFPYRRPLWQTK